MAALSLRRAVPTPSSRKGVCFGPSAVAGMREYSRLEARNVGGMDVLKWSAVILEVPGLAASTTVVRRGRSSADPALTGHLVRQRP